MTQEEIGPSVSIRRAILKLLKTVSLKDDEKHETRYLIIWQLYKEHRHRVFNVIDKRTNKKYEVAYNDEDGWMERPSWSIRVKK